MYDYIVIGAGWAGCVIARELAEKTDSKVLVVERRNHIAGNAYDEFEDGILIQKYGPHFLVTSQWNVIEYVSRFGKLYEMPIEALSYVDDKYVARPYNLRTLQQLVGAENSYDLINELRNQFGQQRRVSLFDLTSSESSNIREYGQLLYEKLYAPYVAKQWGVKVNEIDQGVINRSQIVLGYDTQLVELDYQYLPQDGYTSIMKNILDHPNISLELTTDGLKNISFDNQLNKVLYRGQKCRGIIFTGQIDELFENRLGELPYRSRYFEYKKYQKDRVYPCGVVTYPKQYEYIRTTEFKQFNPHKEEIDYSIVQYEYSCGYDIKADKGNEPYYPIISEKNISLYQQYKCLADKYDNLYLCGRLAEYKYLDMDTTILHAFSVAKQIIDKDIT